MKKLAVFKYFTRNFLIFFVSLFAIDLVIGFIYHDFNSLNAFSEVLALHSIIITAIIAIALTTIFVIRKVRKEKVVKK